MQHQMEGRDTPSFPPSACPLQRGGKKEARLGKGDGDSVDAASVRSLTDSAAAQLCTAALVLVLGQQGGQSCGPDLAKLETPAQLIPASFHPDPCPKACGADGICPGEEEDTSVLLCFITIFHITSVKMQFDLRKLSQAPRTCRF